MVSFIRPISFLFSTGYPNGHSKIYTSHSFVEELLEYNKQDFKTFYEKEVKPVQAVYEEKRLSKLRKLKRTGWFVLITTLIDLYLTYLHPEIIEFKKLPLLVKDLMFFYPIAAVLTYFAMHYYLNIKFQNNYKLDLVPLILSKMGNLNYEIGEKIDENELIESGIFPEYTNLTTEDTISGVYNNLNISIHELNASREENFYDQESGKTIKKNITTFDGFLLKVDFNKNFKGQTIVIPVNAINLPDNNLEKVYLESPEFNDHFDVFTTDQIECRYLLTTSFIERTIKLAHFFAQSMDARKLNLNPLSLIKGNRDIYQLSLSFKNNKMYALIHTGYNIFSVNDLYSTCIDKNYVMQIMADINIIPYLIHELKLNQKIGM